MTNIRQLLFTNWHLMRFIRLAFGIFLVSQGCILNQWFFFIFASFFLFQAIFNFGCGINNCAIQKKTKQKNN